MNYNNLSIVVPTVGYSGLVKSLESYRKFAPGAQVIVVDQTKRGALDQKQIVELTDVYVKVFRALGFAKAMNLGIDIADREYIMCTNDDVELIHIKWFEGILSWFARDPKIVGVNPGSIKGYGNEPDAIPIDQVCTDADYEYLCSPHEFPGNPINPIHPNAAIDGIMIWGTVFSRVGLEKIKNNGCYFDEHFAYGGGEDYDLCCRIYEKGLRIIGVFNSWALHRWFGSAAAGDYNAFARKNDNAPDLIAGLRWNNNNEKWGNQFDIYGRKGEARLLPEPPCIKRSL